MCRRSTPSDATEAGSVPVNATRHLLAYIWIAVASGIQKLKLKNEGTHHLSKAFTNEPWIPPKTLRGQSLSSGCPRIERAIGGGCTRTLDMALRSL